MTIGEKLSAVHTNVERVFDAGCTVGEKRCRAKHFTTVVTGDGSSRLVFDLPFTPDVLHILTNAPDIRTQANVISHLEIDFTALGQLAETYSRTTGNGNGTGTYVFGLSSPTTAYSRFSTDGNGTATVKDVTAGDIVCKFADGVDYIVTAIKAELKPLRTRLEESVARLPDTACSAWYQLAKVQDAFSDEQWDALIATKPNCTFTML